jgi:hypothetical protein
MFSFVDALGLYHSISILESMAARTPRSSHTRPAADRWDLKTGHAEAVAKVEGEMRAAAQGLIDLALDLFDILIGEYDARWAVRRDRVRTVRDWEKPRP